HFVQVTAFSLLFILVIYFFHYFTVISKLSLSDLLFFFFFNDTAPTEIYTLSLHDALPIWRVRGRAVPRAGRARARRRQHALRHRDRKSTRLNSSHSQISYAVFCLKKKKKHKPLLAHNIHNITIDEHGTDQLVVLPRNQPLH